MQAISRRRFSGLLFVKAPLALAGLQLANCRRVDPLTKRLQETKFPLAENLRGLLGKGRVAVVDVEAILAKHEGVGGLYALMALALVQKVRTNGEMSSRYQPFLEKVQALVKDGEIKFDERSVAEDVDFNYDPRARVVHCKAEAVGRALPGEIFESSLLHELWHAYQGVQGRTLRFSERETEAHLAQSDYLWHVKPELLDEDHWIKVFAGKDGEFIQKFFFPGRLMASLVAPAASAEQIEAALTEARPRYLAARLLARVALNEVVVQLQQEVSRQKPDKVKEIIFERVERALAAVRARPLIAHFSSAGASEAGSLGASREVATFSTTVMVLAAGFSNGGKISEAERQINHYILDVWGYELSDLVNSDVVDRRD